MSLYRSPLVRAIGLTIASISVAGAQATPDKPCEVDEGRPTQVGRALLAVQVASSSQDPANASKQLMAAVKGLTENAERMQNPVGRNLVLGKALVLWSIQPNVELTTKRGPLGYTTNPEGMIDLAAAIDTAFKVVEAANPECVPETSRWRGQKAWVTLVNTAIEKMNADDTDAAEAAANKAILLNPFGPYGYVVLANVMQKRGKGSEAMSLYRKSIEVAARDTTFDDIRRQSMAYLGNLAADSAEMAEAAGRRPYTEAARTAFEQILTDKGADNKDKDLARSGLCRVSILSGDTASLRTTYKEQLTAPAGFQYTEIMNAGVCFARAEMIPEATVLFRAAYEKNPYHRDALSNLAIMLLRADKHMEAVPLAERLIEVEPNNQENLQLLVLANAGLAKAARDTRLAATRTAPATKTTTKGKAPATKTTTPAAPRLSAAAQDSLFKLEKQYTDAAVSANEKREKLVIKVALTDFTTSEARATVAGSVTNQGTTGKPVTVRVDFLDAAGKVLATKEQALGEVAAGRSQRFSVTHTPGKDVAAFRYTRIE